MPELPEVEHARKLLVRNVKNKVITQVRTSGNDTKVIQGAEPEQLHKVLCSRQVKEVHRKGKYLWVELDRKPHVLAHFGMTGSFVVKGVKAAEYKSFDVDEEKWPPRFWKVLLVFGDGTECAFLDARRFGRFVVKDDPAGTAPISELGPDALLAPPSVEDLHAMLAKRRQAIKAVLLNQQFLSGIGNWVGDEILYQCKIHPEEKAEDFTIDMTRDLHEAMRYVVGTAVGVDAESSRFPPNWLFHARWTGKKASKTSNNQAVKFITVGSRTTAYVPSIQKKMGKKKRPKPEKEEERETKKKRK
jgi:formamidopyrimidine-DNA glycosylase